MTAERSVAGPYAKAAFELAREKGSWESWSSVLVFADCLSGNPDVRSVLRKTPKDEIPALLAVLGKDVIDAEGLRFVSGLVAAGRLGISAEIGRQFEILRAEAEGYALAEIRTAHAISKAEAEELRLMAEKRFGKRLKVQYIVDAGLQGGAVLRVGDRVFDASIGGALARLSDSLRM